MQQRGSFWLSSTMAIVGLAVAACDRSPDTGVVTTRTEGGATAAPSAEGAARSEQALVRVVNAIPGGKGVDIYAGDSAAFSTVPYRTVTPFRQLGSDIGSFQIRAASGGKAVAENREPLVGGAHYTVIAMPDEAGAGLRNLRVLHDDFAPVPGDKARLRLVNAIPGEDDLTLKLRGFDDELFSDVAFKREAGWKDVDPFVGTLVLLNGKGRTIATLADMKVMGGKSYTLVATGQPSKAEAIVVEDDVRPVAE